MSHRQERRVRLLSLTGGNYAPERHWGFSAGSVLFEGYSVFSIVTSQSLCPVVPMA
ncbi:hypothetical protein GCM10022405_37380 [Gibbsiella dentisursi]|uniref:Uncharacterized protein n=1 Tax=Gibbsiella dentisursi TaxID=796890 RepID=A0ABP7LW25_9GAMM